MKSLNIGMILDAPFPPDIRVEKEALSLIDRGFNVYLLCLGNNESHHLTEYKGIIIKRILWGNIYCFKLLSKLIDRALLNNILWRNAIDKFIVKFNINVLHVHDLPMFNNAFVTKQKKKNVKLILDLHENWPAALQDWHNDQKWPFSLLYKFIHGYRRWKKYEEKAVNKADKIIAVVDEMRNRLIENYNIDKSKIYVVPNYEKSNFYHQNTKVKGDGASVVLECCPNVYSLGYLVFAAAGLKQVST